MIAIDFLCYSIYTMTNYNTVSLYRERSGQKYPKLTQMYDDCNESK